MTQFGRSSVLVLVSSERNVGSIKALKSRTSMAAGRVSAVHPFSVVSLEAKN